MAFFTSQQLFGNGAGAPGGPGWVPIDLSPPPTYTANNRGIAFGEQLTSAIANRPHYALSLNDDDLNTRLAAFEVGGLDAAYDNGTIGPSGGGRIIIKDGGAVETQSALGAQYVEDLANAHFRALSTGNTVGGGVGFESVGFGRLGTGAPLAGLMDRRILTFANFSIIADIQAATLNQGGAIPADVTLGAGQFTDAGTNTDLMTAYDMVEVIGGTAPGLYVISLFPTQTSATLMKLDGTAPAFVINEAVTVRICRPTFGTFNLFGQNGNHRLVGNIVAGVPGQETALDLFPGSKNGRFDTAAASPDGARYALKVRWRSLLGSQITKLTVDAMGQVSSTVGNGQLTSAQLDPYTNFGNAAFIVQQDAGVPDIEAGFVARSNGFLPEWMGVATAGDARPATTPTGVFAFNFINVSPFNVLLTDVTAADWQINPFTTFVEILTPALNAGIYQVTDRDVNNGRLGLSKADGSGIVLPTSGAGTLRVLYCCTLGGRDHGVGTSLWVGSTTYSRAGASFQSPKQVAGTALFLESGNQNATPQNYWLIRGVSSDDGSMTEVFSVTSEGWVAGVTFQSSSEYTYRSTKTYRHTFVAATDLFVNTGFSAGPVINTADPEFSFLIGTGDMVVKVVDETVGSFAAMWPCHLPHGAIVTQIGSRYSTVAGSGPVADDLRFTLCSKQIGAGVLSMKTGAPNYFALTVDGTTRNDTFALTETSGNRTVDNNIAGAGGRTWFLWLARPSTSAGDYSIIIYGVWVEYTITTIAGS